MKNLISLTAILFIAALALTPCVLSAKDSVQDGDKNSNTPKKYTIEETTELMKSRRIGSIKLDHDDHVYKCMKMAKEGGDLEGAIDALIAFNTNLGDSIDNEEVNTIIQISNSDTSLYKNIALSANDIGKKKTTITEHLLMLNEITKKNLGKELLQGLGIAAQCNYKIDNDYFTKERIDLYINIGKITNTARFFDIYEAMRNVGMSRKINTNTLNIIYMMNNIEGDVPAKIAFYLKENKWKSRNQPGKREYEVIRDLMKADYALYLGQHKVVADNMPVQKKVIKKSNTPQKYIAKSSIKKNQSVDKKDKKNADKRVEDANSACICTALK